jgi:hypothetical protein
MTMTRTSLVASVSTMTLAIALFPVGGCRRSVAPATVFEVKVGPGPCDLVPSGDVKTSQRAQDEVRWTANGTTQPLTITFRQSMLPVPMKPFTNMTQKSNGDWVVGSGLRSGPVNPNLSVPPNGLTYKYDQALGTQTCDGRIIIQP